MIAFDGRRQTGIARTLKAALLLAPVILMARPGLAAETASPSPAPAAIPLELNKLESLPTPAATPGAPAPAPGCRFYMVVTNPDPEPITQLRLDLILFGTDGVVARRVALDLGPLPRNKTAVRLFDLAGQPCDGIGRLLVNDVLVCQSGQHDDAPADQQQRQTCLDRLQPTSRTKAELTK